eukprot:9883289-Heterocapsa_arctica.AAC.1
MDPASCKRIRHKYGPYGQTAYGGNTWKGLILGKASKEHMAYGHTKNIGTYTTTYRAHTNGKVETKRITERAFKWLVL